MRTAFWGGSAGSWKRASGPREPRAKLLFVDNFDHGGGEFTVGGRDPSWAGPGFSSGVIGEHAVKEDGAGEGVAYLPRPAGARYFEALVGSSAIEHGDKWFSLGGYWGTESEPDDVTGHSVTFHLDSFDLDGNVPYPNGETLREHTGYKRVGIFYPGNGTVELYYNREWFHTIALPGSPEDPRWELPHCVMGCYNEFYAKVSQFSIWTDVPGV